MSVESNKIIAKFMGGKFSGESRIRLAPQDVWLPIHGVCRWDTIELGRGKTLSYHDSWDWLVPVVKKIREVVNTEMSFEDFDNHRGIADRLNVYDYDMDSIYKGVVEFIKTYNHKK